MLPLFYLLCGKVRLLVVRLLNQRLQLQQIGSHDRHHRLEEGLLEPLRETERRLVFFGVAGCLRTLYGKAGRPEDRQQPLDEGVG